MTSIILLIHTFFQMISENRLTRGVEAVEFGDRFRAGLGRAGRGTAAQRNARFFRHETTRLGAARPGKARLGSARQPNATQGFSL